MTASNIPREYRTEIAWKQGRAILAIKLGIQDLRHFEASYPFFSISRAFAGPLICMAATWPKLLSSGKPGHSQSEKQIAVADSETKSPMELNIRHYQRRLRCPKRCTFCVEGTTQMEGLSHKNAP